MRRLAREAARLLGGLFRAAGDGTRSRPPRDADPTDARDVRAADIARPSELRLLERLARAQLAGRAAPETAHAIGNHLQVMLGNAELAAGAEVLSESARRALARVAEAGEQAAALNRRLHALARGHDGRPATPERAGSDGDLGELLDASLPRLVWLAGAATPLETRFADAARRLSPDETWRRLLPLTLCALVAAARERRPDASDMILSVGPDADGEAANEIAALCLRVAIDPAQPAASVSETIIGDDDADASLTLALLELLVERLDGRLSLDAAGTSVRLPVAPAFATP